MAAQAALTTAAPNGTALTYTSFTKVQFCVLGGSEVTGNAKVVLQVDAGTDDWKDYRVTLPKDEPTNIELAPNKYRLLLTNGDSNTSVVVNVSPLPA